MEERRETRRRTTKDMSRGRSHLLSSHSFSTDSRNRNKLPYNTERKPAMARLWPLPIGRTSSSARLLDLEVDVSSVQKGAESILFHGIFAFFNGLSWDASSQERYA